MKTAIVTTTIHVPYLLEDYIKDAREHGHDFFIVVDGDRKTPPEAEKYCHELSKKYEVNMEFMNVASQENYLNRFPELKEHLQWNCIQRRNAAILRAYELEADLIITIDDDNFFSTNDFIGHHLVGTKNIEVIGAADGDWYNVCSQMEEKCGREFYHRGIPQEVRFQETKITSEKQTVKVVVNAGFWLDDPDLDALTRIYYAGNPIFVNRYSRDDNFALGKGTWSTFNSQNTAIAREVIPAYFLSPKVGRYDDIWGAYVVKKISDHLGHYISFGKPIVVQKRNPHNSWKELDMEAGGSQLSLVFVETLKKMNLIGTDYLSSYQEITNNLADQIRNMASVDNHKEYLNSYVDGMKVWVKTFERLLSK